MYHGEKRYKYHPITIFNVEQNSHKSIFSVLVGLMAIATVTALIATEKNGVCQINSPNDSSGDAVYVIESRCDNHDILVISHDRHDSMIVCEGARDAIVFLKSHGLDVTDTIVIELLTELPDSVDNSATGCYLESERRVLILVYPEFKKFETWFGVPVDRSLYRSVVSHEVAHAVADFNFTISKPSIQAKEYIAYITQFSTMEPELRDRVLEHFSGKAFEGDWQMSPIIYMFDPMGFGIRAYLHFLNLIDADEYIHSILNGEALLDISHIY